MSTAPTTPSVQIDAYQQADEPAVLDLLTDAMGGGPLGRRAPEFFRWKHLENPFGRSFMLLARSGGRVVGLRAFLRWELRAGGRRLRAVRAVDTATHPDFQGMGVFSRLTRAAVEELRAEVDLIFNTPNEKSLPGYLKMGWRTVGTIRPAVRLRRPLRAILGARSDRGPQGPAPAVLAPAAEEVLADDRLASLLPVPDDEDTLTTVRDLAYLRWRFGSRSLLGYRAVVEERHGRTAALAVFRVRPRGRSWEATIAEVLARPGDRQTIRAVLRGVLRAAPGVDHATCLFPPRSPGRRAARRAGFVPSPEGMVLVVNPLREGIAPDPTLPASWSHSLGDLEVF